MERRRLLERLGEAFLLVVLDEFTGALQSLGSDLFGFLHNLGSVYQEMKSASSAGTTDAATAADDNRYDISFSCVPELGRLTLHFRTATAACGYLWAGILKVYFIHSFNYLIEFYFFFLSFSLKKGRRYAFVPCGRDHSRDNLRTEI